MRIASEKFADVLLQNRPMLDVRAPIEFKQGSVPGAVNLPILSDDERHQVGICYKELGQQKAIALGHKLVSGERRERRTAAWIAQVQKHPNTILYCFRGGMRSQLAQQWLAEAGYQIPLIEGGYKALRWFFLSQLEKDFAEQPMLVIGGMTGTGKTLLINQFVNSVDLEGLANHRGSSFGRHSTAQPSQIDFENRLAMRMLRLKQGDFTEWLLEDEGRMIGSVSMPLAVQKVLADSPLAVIEDTLENRVERLLDDYITHLFSEYQATHTDSAFESFKSHLHLGLMRIKKRLGGQRFTEIDKLMQRAFEQCQNDDGSIDPTPHRAWIADLLRGYYDSMYRYQLSKKSQRVIFSGTPEQVIAMVKERGTSLNSGK